MNTEDKKRWLRRAWSLRRTEEYCRRLVTDWGGSCDDSLREKESRGFAERVAEADRAIAAAELEKRKLAINRLTDVTAKKILWLRYIKHYSWKDVCREVNYSRSRCNAIHNKGVEMLQVI